ncbi:MAG: hypothetical protein JSS82_00680 [Bacteroidetes bacterium]|nr:hypothetical protein [Bacteroidota bacterium]
MNIKLAILLPVLAFCNLTVKAQGGTASQTVQLQLNPAIEIASYSDISMSAKGPVFHIKANKEFNVSVSAASSPADLQLAVEHNNTGGTESYMAYAPVQGTNTNILHNCSYGADQTFAVNYRTAGNTDALLVYTATQP